MKNKKEFYWHLQSYQCQYQGGRHVATEENQESWNLKMFSVKHCTKCYSNKRKKAHEHDLNLHRLGNLTETQHVLQVNKSPKEVEDMLVIRNDSLVHWCKTSKVHIWCADGNDHFTWIRRANRLGRDCKDDKVSQIKEVRWTSQVPRKSTIKQPNCSDMLW